MSSSQFPTHYESNVVHVKQKTHHGNTIQQAMGTPTSVTPAKRPDTDTDDVQFISSKPVKRQKINHPTNNQAVQLQVQPESQPVSQYQQAPQVDYGNTFTTSVTAAPIVDSGDISWPGSEVNQPYDRRTTTGMVGLPSGFSDWESIFGFRGCSLPELESYNINAQRLKPAIIISPAISPKQIPKTVTSTALKPIMSPDKNDETSQEHMLSPIPNPPSADIMATIVSHETVRPRAAQPTDNQQLEAAGAAEASSEKRAGNKSPTLHHSPAPRDNGADRLQQPSPLPYGELPASTSHEVSRYHASKQSCKACYQMLQQRAALARAQGLPFFNPNMPLHMLPPGPYHPAFGPQAHPHFMSAMQAGVHQLGPGSSPMMMPISMQNYNGGIVPSPLLPQQYQQHAVQPMPQNSTATTAQTPEIGYNSTAGIAGKPSPQPAATPAATVATSPESPAKQSPRPPPPHPSLLQPNYRKHSPNLIVDVAETCQEKFPFEEVARRHDTTVEKVADVFAAIIQVPLLRCPKDRRRAGRLAHERVKEYNKTKRELQDTAATAEAACRQGGGNSSAAYKADQGMMLQPQAVVRPFDIANALGPTE